MIGDQGDPISLPLALAWARIQSGHTVHLKGGVYAGNFAASRPGVTYRPMPGEHVIIDGTITVSAAGCTFDGFEVRNSAWTTRESAFTGSNPSDITVLEGFIVNQPNTTIQHCTIHDTRQGVRCQADDLLVRDCTFYNNGWTAPDRGHGHGVYAFGKRATVERCVFGPAYDDWGVHIYSDAALDVSGATVRDCVHIGKVAIVYSTGASDDLTIQGCETWRGMLEVGQSGQDHHGITIGNNYLVGAGAWYPMTVRRLKDCLIQNNTFIATDGKLLSYMTPNTDPPISQVWTGNSYRGQDVQDESNLRTWEAWKALHGLDGDSTRVDAAPTQNRVRVINNRLVIIYNWEGLGSIPAPLSGRYTNAQNPSESVTLSLGAPLPMTGWTVASPTAGAGPLTMFDPAFAVFLVQ